MYFRQFCYIRAEAFNRTCGAVSVSSIMPLIVSTAFVNVACNVLQASFKTSERLRPYKSIKHNYLYYYIVPTSYNRSIIKALLQNNIYFCRESSRSSCSKIIFKKVLLKVPHLLKKMSFYVIIVV